MTIYILKAYPTPHKMERDACFIGYFTSKAALFKAIRQYKFLWKPYNEDDFRRALERGDVHTLDRYTDTGSVEELDANTYLVDREELADFVDENYFTDYDY